MKRIYIILVVLIGISISCTKNFEDFNTDKKHPSEAPGAGDYLFANAQKALADQVASTNVNLNVWKLFAQYWTETTYTDEANYDIVNRTIPGLTYRTYYRNILADLKEAGIVIAAESVLSEDAAIEKQNRLFIINLLEAYCYNRLVDVFGNIPYTEALDINNISPAYDDAFTIYKDLINKVDTSLAGLDVSHGSFGENDLYFAGVGEMWIKFGNSLKVKMGITLADVDNTLAQATVESAYQGAFASGELCQLVYLGGTNSNPLYVDLIQSGRHDFVAANTIVDIMNDLEDPRLPAYFTMVDTSSNPDTVKLVYLGGDYGYSSAFSQYSHISDPIQEPTYPMVLLDNTEVEFYLAEAAARGYNVGESAEEHYNNAIKSSFAHWGLSEADADAYLSKPEVAYTTAAGEWNEIIGTQAWLAYYVRGFIGYTSWRRLDYPVLNLPPAPETDNGQVPNRFTYPINEQTLNADNYYQAAQAIGGDLMSTKLFWDKN